MDTPCSYRGFPRGIAGERWRCPCGAPYCSRLCQERDWGNHRETCTWPALYRALRARGVRGLVPARISILSRDFDLVNHPAAASARAICTYLVGLWRTLPERLVVVRSSSMVNRPKNRNAQALREACRALGLHPSWRDKDGKRQWLSSPVMQELEARLLTFQEAKRQHSCDLQERPRAPDAIHMFWEDPVALLGDDLHDRALQPQDMIGL